MHRRVAILEIDNIHSSLKQRKTMLTSHRRVTTMCLNEHTEKWEPCVVKNSSQKRENSNTPTKEEKTKEEKTKEEKTNPENTQGGKIAQESSNNGKAQESSNNGQSSRPVTTITSTPIQAHITTKSHMTATNEQLSENGVLPKLTLAPKPTGPTVAPRVEGAKTIAEVQEAKEKAINEASRYGVSSEELTNEKTPKRRIAKGERE